MSAGRWCPPNPRPPTAPTSALCANFVRILSVGWFPPLLKGNWLLFLPDHPLLWGLWVPYQNPQEIYFMMVGGNFPHCPGTSNVFGETQWSQGQNSMNPDIGCISFSCCTCWQVLSIWPSPVTWSRENNCAFPTPLLLVCSILLLPQPIFKPSRKFHAGARKCNFSTEYRTARIEPKPLPRAHANVLPNWSSSAWVKVGITCQCGQGEPGSERVPPHCHTWSYPWIWWWYSMDLRAVTWLLWHDINTDNWCIWCVFNVYVSAIDAAVMPPSVPPPAATTIAIVCARWLQ